ncbi:MAG: DsrE family protein [Candidatus Scalindua sediminis]
MNEVVVVIRKSPFNTTRNSEMLRMCVGLTLDENKITVVFLGDGVYLMLKNKPELINSGVIHKHIETLQLLKHKLIVEKEVFEKLGKDNIKYDDVEIMNQSQIAKVISTADVVITC